MPRPKNPVECVKKTILLEKPLLVDFDMLTYDPAKGKVAYGKLSPVVNELLRVLLEARKNNDTVDCNKRNRVDITRIVRMLN